MSTGVGSFSTIHEQSLKIQYVKSQTPDFLIALLSKTCSVRMRLYQNRKIITVSKSDLVITEAKDFACSLLYLTFCPYCHRISSP